MSRRRRRKRRRMGTSAGVQALRKVRKIERKTEKKIFDIAVNTIASVPIAGIVTDLAAIVGGSGVSNRTGNRVAPFRLHMNLRWLGKPTGQQDVYRTIIFRDNRQEVSTTPAVLDVLLSGNLLSQYNIAFRGRFKILYDETFTQANDNIIQLSFFRRLSIPLTKRMGFGSNLSTSIVENGLYMISMSNLGAATPDVQWSSRLLFTDS